jgi:hypothetical protein
MSSARVNSAVGLVVRVGRTVLVAGTGVLVRGTAAVGEGSRVGGGGVAVGFAEGDNPGVGEGDRTGVVGEGGADVAVTEGGTGVVVDVGRCVGEAEDIEVDCGEREELDEPRHAARKVPRAAKPRLTKRRLDIRSSTPVSMPWSLAFS